MDDLKEQALAWILDTLQKWLDQAPAYVSDLVNRYGAFFAWGNCVGTLIWLVITILSVRWIIKMCKWDIDSDLLWPIIFAIMVWLWTFIPCLIWMLKWFIVPEIVVLNAL